MAMTVNQVRASIGAFICAGLCAHASAQSYPTAPVRVIIPFPPGQATDVIGRLVSQRLTDALGRQFIIDNRPGAGGIIGAEAVAKAAPDGYTLLVSASGTMVINPSLYRKLSYDPLKDYEPVSLLGLIPLVVVAHPSLPTRTIKDLVALARANPGKLNYGSSGPGTAQHLAMELLKHRATIDVAHVPYKGSAPATTDLIGGHIMLMFDTIASSLSLIKAGKVNAIAVGSARRSSLLPDVPTVAESGIKDFQAMGWAGMLAPARTPRAIVQRLNSEVVRILADAETRQRIVALGLEPMSNSPEEFAAFMKGEIARWSEAVKAAKVSLD
jgi:tripartite-type tricarboxylate transporter receptor subunit TctC